MFHVKQFDVIVIGGGHAGVEAAAASARMGVSTALITHRFDRLGEMSCNPAIGGLGKGQLVREVDALDGLMGVIADKSAIQYRLLNRSKGPAVQGPRSQIDRKLYRHHMQLAISNYTHLDVIEAEVSKLIIKFDSVKGVILADDSEIFAKKVILTTGTFLDGVIHIGNEQTPAGRVGDPASIDLAQQLKSYELPIGRLKTGTPPRLVSKTIDWDRLGLQYADENPEYFSFLTHQTYQKQIACGIAYTNAQTHEIIQENIHLSAMYSGNISGTGPRYCPSIEDKVVRFSDKSQHQVFLEPEGLDSELVYPNGISTSLPQDVQERYVRSINGLENVKIQQYGYAIEYDYIDPRALTRQLSLKSLRNLYLAGQINGTTGYEEAAAQGIIAGLNAACAILEIDFININRTNSYIGVLIDDLITRGVSEPYRMFTSRAEYRLSIRADNADERLTPLAISLSSLSNDRKNQFTIMRDQLAQLKNYCQSILLSPHDLKNIEIDVKADGYKRNLLEVLALPNVSRETIIKNYQELANYPEKLLVKAIIEARYSHYVSRQSRDIEVFEKDRSLKFPNNFNYSEVNGLSNELKQKLIANDPRNIEEANAIEGITPAALLLLAENIKRQLRG